MNAPKNDRDDVDGMPSGHFFCFQGHNCICIRFSLIVVNFVDEHQSLTDTLTLQTPSKIRWYVRNSKSYYVVKNILFQML